MKKHLVCIALALVALSGCGGSSGIVRITDDTYLVAKQDPLVWSGSGIKIELYKEANAHCAAMGKKFALVSERSADAVSGLSSASAELQFKCK